MPSAGREPYTLGYGPRATASMAARTAQNHAAFFLPYLHPGMRLLDCGCGPGTITLGLAEAVAPGFAVGIEVEASLSSLAHKAAFYREIRNAHFEAADIYNLPFETACFDAIFISAVLGNLREPVQGLREAHRVLKPGGVIGLKEFDHSGDLLYPTEPWLDQYGALYQRLRQTYGHDPQGGRKIGVWLLEAGFHDLRATAGYASLTDPRNLRQVAEVSITMLSEKWGDEYVRRGWATIEDIQQMGQAWRRFAQAPGAFCAQAWCEAIARKAATT